MLDFGLRIEPGHDGVDVCALREEEVRHLEVFPDARKVERLAENVRARPLAAKRRFAAHLVLEGVRINGHWAIIYSKYDIGCALERHTGIECKGYTYESALKIAGNIVIYSTLP